MEPIQLSGGVDLNSPAGLARAGTLADCLNYEVTTRGGYSRILGVERFDGGPGVAQFKIMQFGFTESSGSFSAGDAIVYGTPTEGGYEGYDGFVISVDVEDGTTYVTVALEGGEYTLSTSNTLWCDDTDATAVVGSINAAFKPAGRQDVLDAALASLAATRREAVLPVPGRAGSDVIAAFFFRNTAYAVRDLPVVYYEGGYYTDANEGQAIEIAVGDGEPTYENHVILDAQVTGFESGYVIYDPRVDETGAPAATPIGAPTLTSLPISGSLDGGYTMIPYSDGYEVTGGLPPYVWTVIDGDDEPLEVPDEGGDLSEVDFLVEQTPAALWQAQSAGGWEMVGSSREIAFSAGTDALRNFPRSLAIDPDDIITSSASYPTDSELNGAVTTAPNANDGTNAALDTTSGQVLKCLGFDFASLPDGAQVLGIKVEIERSAAANSAIDAAVSLVGLPGRCDNKSGGLWPAAMGVAIYGGESDTWGIEGLRTEQVKDAAFGVLLVAKRSVEATPMSSPLVDFVRVTITYAMRAGTPIYFWDGTSDVPAVMLHAQPTSGDATINTLAGTIALTADVNSAKTRLVNIGEQIRTAPAGAGLLLALTASRDKPVFLPGQIDIDHNRSRYQFRQENFFGQDSYDAIYGVSGAGPAFAFDGSHIIKIRSPLQPHNDVPRHIAKHGDSLVLGYFGGALLVTRPGNPMETRAEEGASALEMGDRIMALSEMAGDALGIICQSRTGLLRGLTELSFYKSTVSARRGGLEYSAADMGRVIVADSFGLFAADTPESFAAAERNYLSVPVEPWLRERLQATRNTEQRYLRPVASLAVRAKNQYRLYFRDGFVLTMTVRENVEYTMQRYFTESGSDFDPDTPWAVRALAAGIDANGRERLFCSFNGIKRGYLFEMDGGNTLDADSIPHHIELNPINFGGMSQLVKLGQGFVAASGYGYANLNVSRKMDMQPFQRSDESNIVPMLIGRVDYTATIVPQNLRASFDFPGEGYEFSLRFSGQSGNEGPHTLQIVWIDHDKRGTSRGNRGE